MKANSPKECAQTGAAALVCSPAQGQRDGVTSRTPPHTCRTSHRTVPKLIGGGSKAMRLGGGTVLYSKLSPWPV